MSLVLNSCSFGYIKNEQVFENISFELKKGELLSILGPNGSGKTSLIKCITGIEFFDKGNITLDGKDISLDKKRGAYFAYVPQLTGSPVSFSVNEMVLLGRSRFLGDFEKPGDKELNIVNKILKEIGIYHLKDRCFSSISGGERQMVLIARALATEAKVFVFDEPTSALDLIHQHRTLDLMVRLCKQKGFALIFSTHDPTHALHISDKSLLMSSSGENLFNESKYVITTENLKKVFKIESKILDFVGSRGEMAKAVIPLLN